MVGLGDIRHQGAYSAVVCVSRATSPPLYLFAFYPLLLLRKSSLVALSCPLLKFPGNVVLLTFAEAVAHLARAQLQGHPFPRAKAS